MKVHNFVIKNIDLFLNTDVDILDLFFVKQNNNIDPRTRYIDFAELRPQHIRANYWQYNTTTDLPLLTYWIEDYNDGLYSGCRKDITVVFRITLRSQIHDTPVAPELVDVIDPLDFADKLFTFIKCKFQKDPNLFSQNECSSVEDIDCNGVTSMIDFKYNVRGYVNGEINNRELPENDKEVIQYEIGIPVSICKVFTDCPCAELEGDC